MLELLATACAGLFAGAAVFVSAVQHPAALESGTRVAGPLFPPFYRRAASMQAGLAVVGSLAGILAWLSGSGAGWLVGSLLLGSVIPFTLVAMRDVNARLLAPELDPGHPELRSCCGAGAGCTPSAARAARWASRSSCWRGGAEGGGPVSGRIG